MSTVAVATPTIFFCDDKNLRLTALTLFGRPLLAFTKDTSFVLFECLQLLVAVIWGNGAGVPCKLNVI